MLYTSTRDSSVKVSSAQAITQGISKDGGLFVPESIPQISLSELSSYVELDYIARAKKVLSMYLTDFTEQELDYCIGGAYGTGKFNSEKVAPMVEVKTGEHLLELWHGPTCAFKDMALQLLPYLLTVSAKKTADGKQVVILVATSGDTGKAALEGFKDVENTKILVFYPSDGVSPMQKLQMTTQEGENVSVCAIKGNFDDAQNGVKQIFTNKEIADKLAQNNMMFSSANSINWGRLVPQIVYYISAYCDMIKDNKIACGDSINVCVPTGNFGNILAAYYAKKMGLPINKLICASNSNNVLTDFLQNGEYDRNRDFYTTISPSMDILISSNLERLLFDLTGYDAQKVTSWMKDLTQNGKYTVDENIINEIKAQFTSGCCDDAKTKEVISTISKEQSYLCDTHTAVAVGVYEDYKAETSDETDTIIASTANPYKFSAAVLEAVKGETATFDDEFDMVEELNKMTSEPIPKELASLRGKQPRFAQVCEKDKMENVVYDMLGIK